MQDASCTDDQKDLPKKEDDPWVVVLSVSIGNMKIGSSIIDLGASVNIVLLSVVEMIGYLRVESTTRKL